MMLGTESCRCCGEHDGNINGYLHDTAKDVDEMAFTLVSFKMM